MAMISVAIPTHQVEGNKELFTRLLESLWKQTYQDFEIVVSDNSENDDIKEICEFYKTGISYYRNPVKGMAQNTNETIRRSKGEMIKILYMDDYLMHKEVLSIIALNSSRKWIILGADNNPDPQWTHDIQTGNNRLGSPSALAIQNDNPLLFDENLTWLLDCDLYKRYQERDGEPLCVIGKHIGIGLGEHQLTNTIPMERKSAEHEYLMQKHG